MGAARLACRYLAQCYGDKDLGDIKRTDATELRDFFVKKGLSGGSTVFFFTTIKAVFNFVGLRVRFGPEGPLFWDLYELD